MQEIIRLNLGAAHSRIEGFLSVDLDASVKPDVMASLDNLPFEENSVTSIYASHVLEHYLSNSFELSKKGRLLKLLVYWKSLLKENGELFLGVPDFAVLAELFTKSASNLQAQERVFDVVYGGHRNEFDLHYYGFSYEYLKDLLEEAGFSQISKFKAFGNDETKHRILDQEISLNVKATKGPKFSEEESKFKPLLAVDELSIFKRASEERLNLINTQADVIRKQQEQIAKLSEILPPKKALRNAISKLIESIKVHYFS